MDVQPPSVFLAHMRHIRQCSLEEISDAITRLSEIYIHPQVRGSTRRSPSHRNSRDRDVSLLNVDSFERSFAIQWLTRLISVASGDSGPWDDDASDVLEQAASLLAVCSGATASGNIQRTFTFPFAFSRLTSDSSSPPSRTPESATTQEECNDRVFVKHGAEEIRVILRDGRLDSADFAGLGAQTWGASCVLAEMIAEDPSRFGMSTDLLRSPLRALELGAGTGLASLVLRKVLDRLRPPELPKHEYDIVVATDFHPSVLSNLKSNVERNFPHSSAVAPSSSHASSPVVVLPLDWSMIHAQSYVGNDTYTADTPPLCAGSFDIIIGADIVYEPLHAQWLRNCVLRFLRKPTAHHIPARDSSPTAAQTTMSPSNSGVFHLIIPLRQTHYSETCTVEEVFASEPQQVRAMRGKAALRIGNEADDDEPFSAQAPVLGIIGQEDVVCDAYVGTEGEEVIYRYYKIGWMYDK